MKNFACKNERRQFHQASRSATAPSGFALAMRAEKPDACIDDRAGVPLELAMARKNARSVPKFVARQLPRYN